MSVQVRRRREAASFLASFVGAQGELIIDTTNNRVQVHDGVTPGGWPAARLADVPSSAAPLAISQGGTGVTSANAALVTLGAIGRTAVADAAYAALASDRTIAYTALTAARVVNLPAASAYPTGTQLLVVDESGACNASRTITLDAAGSDLINGAGIAVIALPYGFVTIESNGVSRWTVVDQSTASLAQQSANTVAITGGTIDGTTIGATTAAPANFTSIGFGSSTGAAGTANKIALYGSTFGFGVSGGVLTYVAQSGSVHGFYVGASSVGSISSTGLNGMAVGATTAATVRGTTVSATTSVNLPSYTVAALPTGVVGALVYASNGRKAGEAAGSGTGVIAYYSNSAWRRFSDDTAVAA